MLFRTLPIAILYPMGHLTELTLMYSNQLNSTFVNFTDTPSNSKMLSMLLRKRGVENDVAENGREAIDAIIRTGGASSSYDIIFMDFTMPVMVRWTQKVDHERVE